MRLIRDIPSPVTGNKTILEDAILVRDIVESFGNGFRIDVATYFQDVEEILLLRCIDTDYKFFYPYNIVGDSTFYEHLQQFEWYYMPWKWEHQEALQWINPNMAILEVGCAKGDFLKRIRDEISTNVIGLELNQGVTHRKGIPILNESVQDHSNVHVEKYDIVCSFQVLEHVAEVKEFLESCIKMLKKGGRLIVSVPNNDSFLKHSKNPLNRPPHHMGLWSKNVFINIQDYFDLKLITTVFEPPQEYHYDYFKQTTSTHLKSKYGIPHRITRKMTGLMYPLSSKTYKSFTILGVFEKK